jgi:hypothetical protein
MFLRPDYQFPALEAKITPFPGGGSAFPKAIERDISWHEKCIKKVAFVQPIGLASGIREPAGRGKMKKGGRHA